MGPVLAQADDVRAAARLNGGRGLGLDLVGVDELDRHLGAGVLHEVVFDLLLEEGIGVGDEALPLQHRQLGTLQVGQRTRCGRWFPKQAGTREVDREQAQDCPQA